VVREQGSSDRTKNRFFWALRKGSIGWSKWSIPWSPFYLYSSPCPINSKVPLFNVVFPWTTWTM
jgi:hypothetical protein